MTLAAVDRLDHRATTLELNVESYRRRTAIERRKGPGRPQAARQSKPPLIDARVASPKDVPERVCGCLTNVPERLDLAAGRQAAERSLQLRGAEQPAAWTVSRSWRKNSFVCDRLGPEAFEDEAQRVLRAPCLEPPLHRPQKAVGIAAGMLALQLLEQLPARPPRLLIEPGVQLLASPPRAGQGAGARVSAWASAARSAAPRPSARPSAARTGTPRATGGSVDSAGRVGDVDQPLLGRPHVAQQADRVQRREDRLEPIAHRLRRPRVRQQPLARRCRRVVALADLRARRAASPPA